MSDSLADDGRGVEAAVTPKEQAATLREMSNHLTLGLDLLEEPKKQETTDYADALLAAAEALEERDALRERVAALEAALRRVLFVASDRQAFVMEGPRAFAVAERAARDALSGGTDELDRLLAEAIAQARIDPNGRFRDALDRLLAEARATPGRCVACGHEDRP